MLFDIIVLILLFILGDAPYLYLTKNIFKDRVKRISGGTFTTRYYSALFVYIALALGLYIFVIPKISKNDILGSSIIYGLLFGSLTYAVFDFTTHFLFEEWDILISLMDTLWGGILCAFVLCVYCYYKYKM